MTLAAQLARSDVAAYAPAHCFLDFISAAEIRLKPVNGGFVAVGDQVIQIAEPGISLANTAVAADGLMKYVYLYMAGGAPALEAVATAPAWVAGRRVKSGDLSRLLVGMVVRSGDGSFYFGGQNIYWVRSWFNDPGLNIFALAGGEIMNSAAPYVELTSAFRIHFLAWGDDEVSVQVEASVRNTSNAAGAGYHAYLACGIDGGMVGNGVYETAWGNASYGTALASSKDVLTEGYHWASQFGGSSGGSGGSFTNRVLKVTSKKKGRP